MSGKLGDLPPQSARLCLEVEKACHEALPSCNDATFLLALSGGMDSTAMASIFSILAPRNGWRLHGLNINHGIRPEAQGDTEFTREMCSIIGIEFHQDEFSAPELAKELGMGLEEAGRKGRHAILESWRAKLGASHILLAHHLGDLCEDVLMRLIRGAGWPALGGMRALSGKLFRPLLQVRRERLAEFLASLDQDWREDLSNQDMAFRRNRIRAQAMPLLKMENPSVERSFSALHQLSLADELFWREYLEKILEEHAIIEPDGVFGLSLILPLSAVQSQPLAARLRLYHYAINKLPELFPCKSRPQAQFEKLVALDRAVMKSRGGKIFQFQGALAAKLADGKISFILRD